MMCVFDSPAKLREIARLVEYFDVPRNVKQRRLLALSVDLGDDRADAL